MSDTAPVQPGLWVPSTLGALCEVDPEILGASTPREYRFRYIDISSVSPLSISEELQETSFALAPSRARKKVRRNDVLMATVRPNLKAFARVKGDDDLVASTGFAVLRARDGVSDPRFIEQALFTSGIESQIEGLVAGSNYPAITVANVRRLKLMAPPLAEQSRIADLLSAVDEQIQAAERSIEKQQTVLASVSRRLLPDPGELSKDSSRLGSVALIRRGASPRPIQDPRWFAEAGRGWVRISDVTKTRRFLDSTEQRLSPEGVACSVPVDPGQVIMSICATVGEARLVTTPVCVHDGFVVFNDHPAIEARYLRYLLERSKQWLLGQGQTGTQSNLNTDIVRALPVRLPSWERQVEVANVLDALNDLVEIEQAISRKLRHQKVALLQRLLNPL